MDEVFQEFYPIEAPAHTTTTVKEFLPGILIEVDAIVLKT